jgi:polysaccharide biosynthesis transport protein
MQDPLATALQSRATPQITQLLGLLRKRKWLILGLTVCAGVATGLVVSKQRPTYEATASIVIELSVPQYLGSGFRDVVDVEPSWWQSRETLETEFRTLRSYSQSLAVAKALCERTFEGQSALRQLVPNATCKNPDEYAQAAPLLQKMLRVTPVKDTRIVELTVSSPSPAYAALVTNTVAQVFEQRNLERRLSHSANAATWLGDEYNQLASELRQAEQAMVDFKTKYNIVAVSLEDDQNEVLTRRKKLAEQLSAVEVQLIALRSEKEQLATSGAMDVVTEANPALSKNPIAQKLKELYIEEYGKLVALQGKYGDKMPQVFNQQERLNQIKRDLEREGNIARETFKDHYALLTRQAEDLRKALKEATTESIRIEGRITEYNRLKRNLDRVIKLTEQVGGRAGETSLASNLRTNNIRILDRALVPGRPVAPNVPRAVGMSLVAALLLSFGLALLLDAIDNSVKTQEDVEQTVGMTLLGLIPTIEHEERNGARNGSRRGNQEVKLPGGLSGDSRDLHVLTHPTSQVAECCRAIRTNLLFMSPDNPAKTMLITSAGPQEGKTTVAVSLAITLAQSGLRVLLVDTDMRRPRIHKALGIPSSVEGVSSAILGKANVKTFVRDSGVPNLWILPCGASPPNPAELLHAERFRNMVHELTQEFDRVIFDSPPLGAVTDASILARITDATVMVAKAGRTSKYALAKARRQVGDGTVNVLGCILNDLSLSRQREYGYYSYYYSRYGYYGPSEDQQARGSGQA